LQTNIVIEAGLPRDMREYVPPLSNATGISKRTHQFERRTRLHPSL